MSFISNDTSAVLLASLNATDDNDHIDINKKYYLHIIVPILWSLIIIFGIVGNGLIIYIILKRRLYKNSCTNCYIINVAVADLCFTLICVPITMSAYIYEEWIFGEFMCQFENLLMFSSVQAACLTLTAMTIDRYAAILYPLKSIDFRTTKIAFLTNIFIWIASFTLNTPYFFFYKQKEYSFSANTSKTGVAKIVYYCTSNFPNDISEIIMTLYTVMIAYVLPLLIIIFCYIRMILKIVRKSKSNYLTEEYRSSFKNNSSASTQQCRGSNIESVCELKPMNVDMEAVDATSSVSPMISMKFTRSSSLFAKKASCTNNLYSSTATIQTNRKSPKLHNNIALAKKQRTKLLFLIATVAITFATTWLPAHVIQIWKVVFNKYFPYSDAMYIIKVISHTLTYSNSLLNPIIYVFIGAKFRSYIYLEFAIIRKCFCCFGSSRRNEDFSTAAYSFNSGTHRLNAHTQLKTFSSVK